MTLLILPTALAVPVYVSEEIAVGRSVFQNFVHEEFEEEGVPEEILEEVPEEILNEDVSDRAAAAHPYGDENVAAALGHVGASGVNTRLVTQVGATIRELANEFAQSRERKRLKEEAERVEVSSITYDGFFELCDEVFRHGITKENVIALFFFCADMVIRCVKTQMKDIGIRLFKWALQYIVDRVCSWVSKHGGWEKAIRNSLSNRQLVAISAAAVGIFAVSGFFIYKWGS